VGFHAGAAHHDLVEIAHLEGGVIERRAVVALQQK
jgi:hypothetical protein